MSFQPQEPKIVSKGAFLIAGMRYQGKNEHGEIPAMWELFLPRISELVGSQAQGFEAYGVARSLPDFDKSGEFEYLAAVEAKSLDNLPEGMTGWQIPAYTYAVLPAQDVPGIGPVSHYYYQEWLPKSQEYEMDGNLMMEVYPETYSQDLVIYLYFPVKRKSKG